jgi:polyphosphate kinase
VTVAGPAPESVLFINRELSWLAFNERVLEEAADPAVPLLERVKFAAIAAANLDEFFMVRVAGLRQAVADDEAAPDPAGLTPTRQLAAIGDRAHAFVANLYALVTNQLQPALAAHRIRLLTSADLNDGQRAALGQFFAESVLPVLTPLAIDVSRPFPLLSSLSLNIAVVLSWMRRPARPTTGSRWCNFRQALRASYPCLPSTAMRSSCSKRSSAPTCPSSFRVSRSWKPR